MTQPALRTDLESSVGRRPDLALASGATIRVVHCVTRMDMGGTEMNVLRTAERLDRDRFEVVVATLVADGPLLRAYHDAGIRVEAFPLTSLHNRTAVREGVRLWKFLRSRRPTILHCHDVYSNIFGVTWGRAAGVAAVIASRRWMHPVDDRRLEVANRLVYRLAHRVLGNSGAVTQLLSEADGVPATRVWYLPNFVDDRAFEPLPVATRAALRQELRIPDGAEVIGCIARLVEVKDHATLLRAFARLASKRPALHLILIGDGDCRRSLEQLASELGIAERTRFAGFRPNTPNLNHLFDVSVLASRSEGFPNTLVEAMAAGRPVVATDAAGNRDAVRPETGVLVPIAAPDRMAEAIGDLLDDPERRARLGATAQTIARREYHADAVVPQLEGAYLRLVKSR